MGGGGGSSRSFGDIKSLLDKAKEELRKGNESERRNVFISFAYEDIDAVNLLRGQAKNENSPIEFNDWSVREPFNSERASYIKQKISEKINQCSVTIVYLTADSAKSAWVKWEIEKSKELGKGVIGVYEGNKAPKIPQDVTKSLDKVVKWNQKDIMKAIDQVNRKRNE